MPSLSTDVLTLKDAIVAFRRDLHQHPDLAYAETRTASKVVEFLNGAGLQVRTGVGGTGIIASTGRSGGRTVLLRVDLDGLPIQEQSDAPYASQVPGRMHACGHDGHVAMGAGAARVLAGRPLTGAVRVLFQPAEEGEGGAQSV